MLHILWGADDFSISEWLNRAKKGLGDESLREANTNILDGQKLTPQELGSVAGAAPFLAEKRLVIVEGLLGRFEARGKKGGGAKPAAKDNGHTAFSQGLKDLPPSSMVVFVDGVLKPRNPLLKELAPLAEVKTFPRPKGEALKRWITKRVGQDGGKISPPAVELLAQLVGGDLWTMAGEVAKLALYASGETIDEEMVRRVVGYQQQANVFAMVDAILEFKTAAAQKALGQLLQAGGTPSYLLYMLTRQLRQIVRAKELLRRGRPEIEVRQMLGANNDFVWSKLKQQASGYSMTRLKEIYARLLDTDLAVKTGRYSGDLAVNILITELSYRR